MSQRTQMEARARAQRKNTSGVPGQHVPGSSGGQSSPKATVEEPEIGLRQRLRYRFDVTLAKGTGPLILWLAAVTAAFVVITAIPLALVAKNVEGSESSEGFWHAAWGSLTNTLDPGTVAGDSTEDWTLRFVALAITIVGIFIFSSLIGLISSVIDRMVENLRKGRGTVVEEGHTLILGWSDKLHTIISELAIANANQKNACVVILADRDKVDMEDEINSRHGSGNTQHLFRKLTRQHQELRIVCRTGDPADPADLAIVGPTRAKTVIVLGEERDSPDAQNVKVMLSLMSFDRALTDIDVTLELREATNAAALHQATGGRVRTVVSSELIARITAQICRQAGMGSVYQELLDFDGDELYFQELPELVGSTYGQALLSFERSSILGLRTPGGEIVLNPRMNTRIAAGDQLIAVSEDDDTVVVSSIDSWESSSAALG
ncbi:MAG: potassium transporter TrkA, partial [Thermoleophilia bacterium]|nr:potassium transporter TrkA [Thermoleophilia bacterium]